MSVGTGVDGITAQVVFVPSFEALDAMTPEQVKGKIVVYNPGWHGWGGTRCTGRVGRRVRRRRVQWRAGTFGDRLACSLRNGHAKV